MSTIKIDQITIPCKAISELGASAAVLLAFLCEIHRKYERKNELLERGFFPCTRQELTDIIGMLRRQQENAIAELSDLKYIKVKANQPGFNGGIRLFRINKELLIELGYYKENYAIESISKSARVAESHPEIKPQKKESSKKIDSSESKSKKKPKIKDENYDLFSLFGEEEILIETDPTETDSPITESVFLAEKPSSLEKEEITMETFEEKDEELITTDENDIHLEDFFPEHIETQPENADISKIAESLSKEPNKSTFFDDHNWITNPSNIIYHPQSQMQQQLAEKIHTILTKEIDIYSKCSDLLTILGIRAQLEYFDMHNLSKCGDNKIQQTIDTLLNFARIAPTLSPIKLKFHQAILVEIIKYIIKGHNRSILSFEYRTESPQPKQELQKILIEHYNDYQFNINIV